MILKYFILFILILLLLTVVCFISSISSCNHLSDHIRTRNGRKFGGELSYFEEDLIRNILNVNNNLKSGCIFHKLKNDPVYKSEYLALLKNYNNNEEELDKIMDEFEKNSYYDKTDEEFLQFMNDAITKQEGSNNKTNIRTKPKSELGSTLTTPTTATTKIDSTATTASDSTTTPTKTTTKTTTPTTSTKIDSTATPQSKNITLESSGLGRVGANGLTDWVKNIDTDDITDQNFSYYDIIVSQTKMAGRQPNYEQLVNSYKESRIASGLDNTLANTWYSTKLSEIFEIFAKNPNYKKNSDEFINLLLDVKNDNLRESPIIMRDDVLRTLADDKINEQWFNYSEILNNDTITSSHLQMNNGKTVYKMVDTYIKNKNIKDKKTIRNLLYDKLSEIVRTFRSNPYYKKNNEEFLQFIKDSKNNNIVRIKKKDIPKPVEIVSPQELLVLPAVPSPELTPKYDQSQEKILDLDISFLNKLKDELNHLDVDNYFHALYFLHDFFSYRMLKLMPKDAVKILTNNTDLSMLFENIGQYISKYKDHNPDIDELSLKKNALLLIQISLLKYLDDKDNKDLLDFFADFIAELIIEEDIRAFVKNSIFLLYSYIFKYRNIDEKKDKNKKNMFKKKALTNTLTNTETLDDYYDSEESTAQWAEEFKQSLEKNATIWDNSALDTQKLMHQGLSQNSSSSKKSTTDNDFSYIENLSEEEFNEYLAHSNFDILFDESISKEEKQQVIKKIEEELHDLKEKNNELRSELNNMESQPIEQPIYEPPTSYERIVTFLTPDPPKTIEVKVENTISNGKKSKTNDKFISDDKDKKIIFIPDDKNDPKIGKQIFLDLNNLPKGTLLKSNGKFIRTQ